MIVDRKKQQARKRNQEQLPIGVYPADNGKYRAIAWENRKHYWSGTFDTADEAHYEQLVNSQDNHWEGMPPNSMEGAFGFIYRITNKETGKMYIGSKQFYRWAGPQGGYKVTDPLDDEFDPKAYVEHDWRYYTGSSVELNQEMAFVDKWEYRFEVIELCRNVLDLHLAEIRWQVDEGVLEALDESGQYLYYNKNIAGKLFRRSAPKENVLATKEETEEAIRVYYLKPRVCQCGSTIPYGTDRCTKCNS